MVHYHGKEILASYNKVIHDFIHFLLLLQRADTTCDVLSLVWRNIDGSTRSTEHRRPISMRTLFLRGRTLRSTSKQLGLDSRFSGWRDGRTFNTFSLEFIVSPFS